jgi:fatty-acyl-CoA synthase
VTEQELIAYLEPGFVRWWLPDAVVFVDEIPRTAAGKFRKTVLRDRFRTHYGVT